MVPTKEINELASAIAHSEEFSNMIECRKRVMGSFGILEKSEAFEEEKNHIFSGNVSPADISLFISRMMGDQDGAVHPDDFSRFIEATEKYQRMLAECLAALHSTIESHIHSPLS